MLPMSKTSTRAFTLIELLVVITIVLILASIAYPVYTGVQERARATQDLNNLRQIGLATQMYWNDNDGVLFDATTAWMGQLCPKYVPSWKIFQSPFDKRSPSEVGDATTPVSYGLNANKVPGLQADKILKPSVFILFAPAQSASGKGKIKTVSFQGTPVSGVPGVTVYKNSGGATSGTYSGGTRINALFADLHTESMSWLAFQRDTDPKTPSDPDANYRWDYAGK
jgi:prepilin-type N-terminal cleavage/methylation domain-containing protein